MQTLQNHRSQSNQSVNFVELLIHVRLCSGIIHLQIRPKFNLVVQYPQLCIKPSLLYFSVSLNYITSHICSAPSAIYSTDLQCIFISSLCKKDASSFMSSLLRDHSSDPLDICKQIQQWTHKWLNSD